MTHQVQLKRRIKFIKKKKKSLSEKALERHMLSKLGLELFLGEIGSPAN